MSTKTQSKSSSETASNLFEPDINQNTNPVDSDLIGPIGGNRTFLYYQDNDFRDNVKRKHVNYYKKLELYNRGTHNGKWSDQQARRNQDDWAMCRSISGEVGLPAHLQEQAWSIFKPLDLRKFKKYEDGSRNRGLRKQYLVIFSISALLYNEHQPDEDLEYYPTRTPQPLKDRDRYGIRGRHARKLVEYPPEDCDIRLHHFANEMNFGSKDIMSCMNKIRELSNTFS